MIWARLDGPDTGALLPEVVVVVCSRVPRAEARDRFVVLLLLRWLERTTLILAAVSSRSSWPKLVLDICSSTVVVCYSCSSLLGGGGGILSSFGCL